MPAGMPPMGANPMGGGPGAAGPGAAAPGAAAPAGGEPAAAAPSVGGWSGPGFYFSIWKIVLFWIVFMLWVHTTDWVSSDAVEFQIDYLRWNPIVFGVFLLVNVLAWLIPFFWVSFPLLLAAWVAPLVGYIAVRNKRLQEHERVMTAAHLRYWFALKAQKLGLKVEAEAPDPNTAGAAVMLSARGGPTPREESARFLQARQMPGLTDARRMVADGLGVRADAIMMESKQEGAEIRHLVDGVWHNGAAMEREVGDPALEALKVLCGMNAEDRVNRQEGKFGCEYQVLKQAVFDKIERAKAAERKKLSIEVTKELTAGEESLNPVELEQKVQAAVEERIRVKFASPYGPWTPVMKSELGRIKFVDRRAPESSLGNVKQSATLSCAGTPTGERALIQFESKQTLLKTFDDLGMRPKMQEQLREQMAREQGMLLLSAMPGMGLRTTMHVLLRSADRFTREYASIEDEANRYEVVENVPATTYKAAAGQTPATVIPDVANHEPDVFVVRDLVNAETVGLLLAQISRAKLVLSSIRAANAVEAVYRVLALKVPPSDLAQGLCVILNQRLVRKLCEHCKEPYVPPAQTLTQLGLPAGRIQAFYRPPQQREEECPVCGGIGYVGRTAVFEILIVDDAVRKALACGAKPDVLLRVARQSGFRSLQEEGVLLVAKGTTSLQELVRTMK
ncbi:MAG: ATPase, T2SS/T4P/T4SS family [Thermoguttaceae bacterium]